MDIKFSRHLDNIKKKLHEYIFKICILSKSIENVRFFSLYSVCGATGLIGLVIVEVSKSPQILFFTVNVCIYYCRLSEYNNLAYGLRNNSEVAVFHVPGNTPNGRHLFSRFSNKLGSVLVTSQMFEVRPSASGAFLELIPLKTVESSSWVKSGVVVVSVDSFS